VVEDPPHDAHPLYFRYAFLNWLRDEVGLTLCAEKATLFHFIVMTALVGGPFTGVMLGMDSHSWSRGIVVGVIVSVIGLAISLPLPQLLWKVLCLFARHGWFLAPERSQSDREVPVITRGEFTARSKSVEREERRQLFVRGPVLLVLLGALYGLCRFGEYLERTKAPTVITVLLAIAVIATIIGIVSGGFGLATSKRLWRKYGLLCPACGRKITDAAGLTRVPYLGLCKHCGAKIIER
jgi:hypothetical protein